MRLVIRPVLTIAAILALVLPQLFDREIVDILVFTCIYSIAGLGVGLLLRTCGIINAGQALFYGVGAYTTAYLSIHYGVHWLVDIAGGALLSATIALLLGWPILRLQGYFLTLATIALGIIGHSLFFEWVGITGGELGIGGIPTIVIAGNALNTPISFYYLTVAVLAACLWIASNLINSRTGLMLQGMRNDADAAASLSVDNRGLEVRVFVLSAIFGSLAGSLFAHYTSFVGVHSFDIVKSITFLLIPVLGGAQYLAGLVIGALFVTLAPHYLGAFGHIHQVLFGLALVLVVTLMPGGIAGTVQQVIGRRN
ncbi:MULTISPECIES: branched-chain amino acid ABC transporter permease [unclassified Bradyrhizobium]|uniref:branched-chain amino acid ABC transporter permease n=1 Tax=unclassified Bradyrhizobium TaxID=2631580 RepID=UPI0024790050|nr:MULTISPECIES: branched-chain amino acid ABC transporter permease [unclassified Bradyrhizobium]WGR73130.1 branched-chain amino acid ABC transporter permease [Bradyrhizobium sp. ISRA426]WGR77970.1 branched-chain amino acid ABC transporter permease [Bradyrhizobium sp. ISRA430]WGR88371.1 branched-chain amino acid ABC transporter permease [Bradyrhizobium sp. ISRA432]